MQTIRRNPNNLIVVASAAKKRLRAAAHRAAILFENSESTRLLEELRERTRGGATPEEIEQFVCDVESKSGF